MAIVGGPSLRRLEGGDTRARNVRLIEGQTAAGIAAAIEALMTRPDSTPLLGGIRGPALVVAGREDVLTRPSEMRQMAAAIAGAQYEEIDGAGHRSNLENPAAFNRLVSGFLASVSGGL